ncbi:alpha/beta hydrolase, partial [Winogradskyella sp. UBA3174]
STGDFSKATTADFAEDVLSAVRYLKSRKDIDSKNIGLIGHSEGGIIAPLAANQTSDISFMITLAGTGIPGSEVSVMQSKSLRPFPVPDEATFEKNVRKSIEIASSDDEISKKRKELKAHNNTYLAPILKSLGASDKNISIFIKKETEGVLKPWNTYFLNYNPADEFEKLSIPVLSLNGSKDIQVNATVNQDAIQNALIKANNKNYKIVELENLNHLFQECTTGKMNEYKTIEQTLSPIALKEISKWILEIIRIN